MRWLLLAVLGCLSACGSSPARVFAEQPVLAARNSSVANELLALPPPTQKLYVGVFAFQDQTGQHKPNENFADYSFAVTQGGATILINALKEAGQEKWFGVLERSRISDLLQERQIIRANREGAVGQNGKQLPPLGPMLNAGIIFEGGIVGYDSNVVTGGIGANVLGIGANINYRRDTVAVYLRAVSVLSGEVLVSVTTDKTIYSTGLQGSANRFVSFNSLFQFEAGFTTNEPDSSPCGRQSRSLSMRRSWKAPKKASGRSPTRRRSNAWSAPTSRSVTGMPPQYQPPRMAIPGRRAEQGGWV